MCRASGAGGSVQASPVRDAAAIARVLSASVCGCRRLGRRIDVAEVSRQQAPGNVGMLELAAQRAIEAGASIEFHRQRRLAHRSQKRLELLQAGRGHRHLQLAVACPAPRRIRFAVWRRQVHLRNVHRARTHVVAAAQRSAHRQLVGLSLCAGAVASSANSAVARVIDSRHVRFTVPFTAPVAFSFSSGSDLLDSSRTTSDKDAPLTLSRPFPAAPQARPSFW